MYCRYIAIVTGLFFISCLATAMHIPMDFPCHGWSAVLVLVCSRPVDSVGVVGCFRVPMVLAPTKAVVVVVVVTCDACVA